MRLAAKPAYRRPPLSSNVRRHNSPSEPSVPFVKNFAHLLTTTTIAFVSPSVIATEQQTPREWLTAVEARCKSNVMADFSGPYLNLKNTKEAASQLAWEETNIERCIGAAHRACIDTGQCQTISTKEAQERQEEVKQRQVARSMCAPSWLRELVVLVGSGQRVYARCGDGRDLLIK